MQNSRGHSIALFVLALLKVRYCRSRTLRVQRPLILFPPHQTSFWYLTERLIHPRHCAIRRTNLIATCASAPGHKETESTMQNGLGWTREDALRNMWIGEGILRIFWKKWCFTRLQWNHAQCPYVCLLPFPAAGFVCFWRRSPGIFLFLAPNGRLKEVEWRTGFITSHYPHVCPQNQQPAFPHQILIRFTWSSSDQWNNASSAPCTHFEWGGACGMYIKERRIHGSAENTRWPRVRGGRHTDSAPSDRTPSAGVPLADHIHQQCPDRVGWLFFFSKLSFSSDFNLNPDIPTSTYPSIISVLTHLTIQPLIMSAAIDDMYLYSSALKMEQKHRQEFRKRQHSESTDDESSSPKSASPSIDDDRRAHHNELERRRRDHIKDHFVILKDSIPLLEGEKSSRALILKRAVEYITAMQSRLNENQRSMDELRRKNELLEEKCEWFLVERLFLIWFFSVRERESSNHTPTSALPSLTPPVQIAQPVQITLPVTIPQVSAIPQLPQIPQIPQTTK